MASSKRNTEANPSASSTTSKRSRRNPNVIYGFEDFFQRIHEVPVVEIGSVDECEAVQGRENYGETTELHKAVQEGNLSLARRLLQQGSNVNAQDLNGNTPLHLAVTQTKECQREIVKLLEKNDADVYLKNARGETALYLSEELDRVSGSAKRRYLVTSPNAPGASQDIENLLTAIKSGRITDVECKLTNVFVNRDFLSANNAKLKLNGEETLLHLACRQGNFDIVKLLFKNMIWTPECSPLKTDNPHFGSLIHSCIENTLNLNFDLDQNKLKMEEIKKIIDLLLEKDNSLINEKDTKGNPPLLTPNVHLELIKHLLEKGAVLQEKNENNGRNFLHQVHEYMTPSQLHELISYIVTNPLNNDIRAVFESTCKYQTVPLHHLVKIMTKETLQLVSSLGVNLNASCSKERTTLYNALAYNRKADFIDALVNLGGTLANNDDGLHAATDLANIEAMQYFISKGSDVNAKYNECSLLEILFGSEKMLNTNMEAVYCLIDNGANLTDENEKAIVDAAVLRGQKDANVVELLKYLISKGVNVFEQSRLDLNPKVSQLKSDFVRSAAANLSPEQFHELLEHLAEIADEKFVGAEISLDSSLYEALTFMEPLISTLELFKFHGVDFVGGGYYSDYDHVFHLAMKANRSVTLLRTLATRFKSDWKAEDYQNLTCFHIAAQLGNVEYIRLIDSLGGCDINARFTGRRFSLFDTPLHSFLENLPQFSGDCHEVVVELLRCGANGGELNENKETPFDVAYRNREYEIETKTLELLRREKCDGDSIFRAVGWEEYKESQSMEEFVRRFEQPAKEVDIDELQLALQVFQRNGKSITGCWKERCENQVSPLHYAVQKKSVSVVKCLLEHGYKDVLDDSRFSNLIHEIVKSSKNSKEKNVSIQKEMISLLVTANRNLLRPISTNYRRTTCLNTESLHISHIIHLIQLGADPEFEENDGSSFLHRAPTILNVYEYHELIECLGEMDLMESLVKSKKGKTTPFNLALCHLNLHEKTIQLIVDQVPDQNFLTGLQDIPVFHAIAGKRSVQFVEMLVTKFGLELARRNSDMESALHFAVRAGGAEMVKYLIGKGLNLNAQDKENLTPLHWAVGQVNTKVEMEIVQVLLESGASVKDVDKEGRSPLHLAILNENATPKLKYDVICLLLKSGVDINAKDKKGRTMLHYGDTLTPDVFHQVCDDLVTSGKADSLKHVDSDGRTVIHHVVAGGLNIIPKTLDLLKEHGGDINAGDKSTGNTVLHLTLEKYYPVKILSRLLAAGANSNKVNIYGKTPLHLAAANGLHHVISVLVKCKADINAKDGCGETPLDIAMRSGNDQACKERIVNELIKCGAKV